jgi:hypothetical protein
MPKSTEFGRDRVEEVLDNPEAYSRLYACPSAVLKRLSFETNDLFSGR